MIQFTFQRERNMYRIRKTYDKLISKSIPKILYDGQKGGYEMVYDFIKVQSDEEIRNAWKVYETNQPYFKMLGNDSLSIADIENDRTVIRRRKRSLLYSS